MNSTISALSSSAPLMPLLPTEAKSQTGTPDFISLFVAYFQAIAQDSYERQQVCKEGDGSLNFSEAKDVLSKGCWYPYDYYRALKKFKQEDRLTWLVKQCAFYHGLSPLKFFSYVEDTDRSVSGKKMFTFKIKDNIQPSRALDAFNETMSLLDCGTICHLAAARALRDLITPEKFDALFSANSKRRFCLSFKQDSSLNGLFDHVSIKNESEIKKGDICHFASIVNYVFKHPFGEARGFNVLCLDENNHTYLGLGLSPKGVNSQQIEQKLHEAYNQDPIEEGFLPAVIWSKTFSNSLCCNEQKSRDLVDSLKDDKVTWEEFQEQPSRNQRIYGQPADGKLSLSVWRPNIERIQKLVKAPLSQVGRVFDSFDYLL
ncbi:hypothetical protein [Candidatus Protochlamydia phocaeensis]|uniref:hypothetical protein n=1 Tax=Candidatus Protochlamydia phocaeensis TaxID=1414722 RepID=UPI0008399467|nr:hypothetical protein [Candidatus Protochlamydia phocaeensis]